MKKGLENYNRGEIKGGKVKENELAPNKFNMKRNKSRLGGKGGGLSLESFANAKSRNDHYNPSLIKKEREFYKNAKYIRKYKKSLKNQELQNTSFRVERPLENENVAKRVDHHENQQNRRGNKGAQSLQELYNIKRDETERERTEREAMMQKKREEKHQVEIKRRALKEKMLKKTKSGQPVMKYRIEHLLETFEGSTKLSS